ncbi:hypothetical protein CRG98_038398 [Punica granatum]|uniref:Uncharacterized protein n=1 Tax=Punica granatum TaxID=22663 RepID=A0A2I0IC17_PUNGR|nr:hypothetical protein CRG98_038398 [Punica granatum]
MTRHLTIGRSHGDEVIVGGDICSARYTLLKFLNKEHFIANGCARVPGIPGTGQNLSVKVGSRARMRAPKCNVAWECPPSRGRATDAREKESPLPVYNPKVEGR